MSDIDYDKIESIARKVSGETQTTLMAQIAKEASKEAVTEMLLVCGIDTTNPLEMQELMAYGKECQRSAPRTKEAIDWCEKTMQTGKIFKNSFVAEAAKHTLTMVFTLGIIWVIVLSGFKTL